jgi:phosphomannomutase
VIEHGADMGIAFDGDFDRCFLFDEKGQFIEATTLSACWRKRSSRKTRGENHS